jgi:hypothetical protein
MFRFINLLFITVIIPWRMIPLARSRGRSVVDWTLGAVGAWIATSVTAEIVSIFIFNVFILSNGFFITRIIGVIFSFLMFEFVRRRLVVKPIAVLPSSTRKDQTNDPDSTPMP